MTRASRPCLDFGHLWFGASVSSAEGATSKKPSSAETTRAGRPCDQPQTWLELSNFFPVLAASSIIRLR